MPSDQEEPPYLEGAAPPQFHKWSDALYRFLIMNRPVAGFNVIIADADGGGKIINSVGGNNLPLFTVDIVAVGVAREGVMIPMRIPPLEEEP